MTTQNLLRGVGALVLTLLTMQTASADTTPVKRLFLVSSESGTSSKPKQEFATYKYDACGYISQYRNWTTDNGQTEPQLSVFSDYNGVPYADGRQIDIDDALDYLRDGYSMDIDYSYDTKGRCTQASMWHILPDGSRGIEIGRMESKAENGRWWRRLYMWEEDYHNPGQYFWCAPGVEGYNQWGDLEVEAEYDHQNGHDVYDQYYDYKERHLLRKLGPDESYHSDRLYIDQSDVCDLLINYRERGERVYAYRIEMSQDKLSAVMYRVEYTAFEHNGQNMPLSDLDKYWEVEERYTRATTESEWQQVYDSPAHIAAAPQYQEGRNHFEYWEDFEGNFSETPSDKFCWLVTEDVYCVPQYGETGMELVISDGYKQREFRGTNVPAPKRPMAPEYQHPVGPFDEEKDEYPELSWRSSESYYWDGQGWYLQECHAYTSEYNNAGDYIYTYYTAENGKRVVRHHETYSFDAQHRVNKIVEVDKHYEYTTTNTTEYTYNSDGMIRTERTTNTETPGDRTSSVTREYTYIANPYYVAPSAEGNKQPWGTSQPFYVSSITWKGDGIDLNGDGIITEDERMDNDPTIMTFHYNEGTYVDPTIDYSTLGIQTVRTDAAARTLVFDMQGRHQAGLRQGLNIVRTSDGRIAKFFVK